MLCIYTLYAVDFKKTLRKMKVMCSTKLKQNYCPVCIL